jgi:3-oxoacyl-[acyl-carrier protein] reductase
MINNKKILITGASRGLGAEVAKYFIKNNNQVALLARTESDLNKIIKKTNNNIVLSVDLLDVEQINDSVNKAINFLGEIDIVIHAAGGGIGLKNPFLSFEEISILFKLNVGAAVEINKIIIKSMMDRKRGNIVHVGSIASSEAVGSVGYNTVKAALSSYVRSIGRELYKYNIIATGILPGGFISRGNAMWRLREKNIEAYNNFVSERLPRKKMGSASEIIPLIELLSSPQASMMGGCMVPIDAGEGRTYCL